MALNEEKLDLYGESFTLQYITGRVQPLGGGANMFLKDADGREHSVTQDEVGIPAREGHLVTVVYATGRDRVKRMFLGFNHDTGDTATRNDIIQDHLCGRERLQKLIGSRFRWTLVIGGAVLGYMSDHRHPMGGATLGAIVGLIFGWLVGIIVAGIGAAKTSHDRMNAFLRGPQLAAIKSRIAKEKQ